MKKEKKLREGTSLFLLLLLSGVLLAKEEVKRVGSDKVLLFESFTTSLLLPPSPHFLPSLGFVCSLPQLKPSKDPLTLPEGPFQSTYRGGKVLPLHPYLIFPSSFSSSTHFLFVY